MQNKFATRMFNHNSATYSCGCCQRRTRETGLGEAALDLCAFCYEIAGLENSYADGHINAAEYNVRLDGFSKTYGKTRSSCPNCSRKLDETPANVVGKISLISGLADRRVAANKYLPARTKSERAAARRAAKKGE